MTVLRFISRLTQQAAPAEPGFYQIPVRFCAVIWPHIRILPDTLRELPVAADHSRDPQPGQTLPFSEHDGGSRMLPNYVCDLDNPLFWSPRVSAMKTYDFIGIGIGPFNLSIAALAEGLDRFSSLFLERKPHSRTRG